MTENYDTNQFISPEGEQKEDGFGCLLDGAAKIARRVLESIQALAGTTACKGVQINELKKYAVETGCWISDISKLGDFSDRGSENEVYLSLDNKYVYKLNDFRYSDDNLTSFFIRITIHNYYFPDCAYKLVGFTYNQSQKVCAVLVQPFIYSAREATEKEIADELFKMGFLPQLEGEYFSNGEFDIFDALPNNVLVGIDGHLYFIDTIIYRTSESSFDLYKNLSPRFPK
ncbi:putative polyvalent protein kinase domain-containing protein [Parabacteroides sp.]